MHFGDGECTTDDANFAKGDNISCYAMLVNCENPSLCEIVGTVQKQTPNQVAKCWGSCIGGIGSVNMNLL